MTIEDRLCQQGSNAEFRQLLVGFPLRRCGDGVQYDDLLHFGAGDSLVSGPTQQTMTGKGKHTTSSLFDEHFGGLAHGTSGVNHIVHNDTITIPNISHQVHLVHRTRTCTLFDNHGKTNVLHLVPVAETVLEFLGPIDTTGIGTHDNGIVQILGSKVIHADDASIQIVHGNARTKETLNLSAVQIHRNDTIDSHGLHETRHIRSRNGHTRLHLAILSCISIVGNDDSHILGTRSVESRDKEQEFHEVVIDGWAGWLHDIAILPAYILVNHDIDFPVGKSSHRGLSEIHV
mmetsp:Transcript_15890/g.36514  ORF Transcript_15890/g.36514 Transcript_15890/m.36514 type:complete len:289 (-) Transcript_15890:571-1437(-)